MNTAEHNNGISGQPAEAAAIKSLGDLASFVGESEAVPSAQRRYLRSAVNRARILLGNGLADVPADPRTVLRQLDRLSPTMADMSRQSFSNLKSRVRTAFRLAAPYLAPARSHTRLTGDLAKLEARLPVREQRQLSRFLRFAQAMGWTLDQIGEAHIERFAWYLEHEVMLDRADKVVRATRRSWNRAAETVPGWPDRRLTPPEPKKAPYWVRLDQLPVALQDEIDDLLHRLEHPDPFLGSGTKGLAPTTIAQFRILFITLASALVASGTPAASLTSIAVLVQPEHFERSLRFLHARAGNRVNQQIYALAYRVPKIAAGVGLPERDLARLRKIAASVKGAAEFTDGLTPKNRHLLEHLDDPAFVDRLLAFPARLMQAAKAASCTRYGASLARDAVAVELLLTCSMRVANLVDLRVGETIKRHGSGRNARWVIEIPEEKVKNHHPLRYPLLPESAELIEEYLADWQPYWCGTGTSWLFPAKGGGHVDPALLTIMIAKRARQYVGTSITCHQFRHLSAELYLREDPTGLGVVSQHLGHRKFDTTRMYYAREQSRVATQRYHAVLTKKRSAAATRGRKSKRRGREVT